MKRLLTAALVAVSIAMLGATVPTHATGVNDFTVSTYDIVYKLSRDDANRSKLEVTETIVAEFPQANQNHGIERAIPMRYDNHPVGLKIKSVTNGRDKLEYSTYESGSNTVLRIGDPDAYVHGTQRYQITYRQRDVTKFFADTGGDEFYWDTNGTDWRVPIEKLTVTLQVDDSLRTALSGESACYQGVAGSNQRCTLMHDDTTITTSATNLAPGENITIAVGFAGQAFAPYQESLLEFLGRIWLIGLIAGGAVGAVIMTWCSVRWSRQTKRSIEVGTIVPEYIPPKDASVTASASLLSGVSGVFTAQLLDFAVRHYIKIYELEEKNLIFNSKDYELEIIRDISDLRDEEREILTDIFGGKTQVGARLKLSSLKNNHSVYLKTLDNTKKLQTLVRGRYGLREQNTRQSAWFTRVGWILLVAAVLLLNPAVLVFALIIFAFGKTLWPLSDKGVELYRYLEGLKLYIKVAEAERIKMLQSPDGAMKIGSANPNDKAQLVKLYERVLPYAVLFGQEKQWNKQIGSLYESAGQQPDWYVSHSVFNAAVFSSAMGSFSTSASYSAGSSSSSGGSSGGGSSGGGGGGGGGGGW